ncbi:BLUF domain-containing protein [Flagellimonas allohymeniacidonis]|uniref:BLUF domain-containing protein n=1 Tax=Flagellimonas allohymeniacidonis TaxID=2517819 RepID=A0A4Q8QEE1_9FLAO|nr:BLUF domain-containing protein [Allomuricauda hymeniacidonis]TAI46659.1 BLUF domain-containing protein [Allomuricauda hymeniacidonis]
MFCLVYRSTASPSFKKSQITEMLEKARVLNQERDITGCLLYYHGEFLQYLEGNQIKVLSLFDRIKTDPRHTNVEVLSNAEIKKREFHKWEMAYEDFLGDSNELQFLKLLTSSYIETPDEGMEPNPTSLFFWRTAKRLLHAKTSSSLYR